MINVLSESFSPEIPNLGFVYINVLHTKHLHYYRKKWPYFFLTKEAMRFMKTFCKIGWSEVEKLDTSILGRGGIYINEDPQGPNRGVPDLHWTCLVAITRTHLHSHGWIKHTDIGRTEELRERQKAILNSAITAKFLKPPSSRVELSLSVDNGYCYLPVLIFKPFVNQQCCPFFWWVLVPAWILTSSPMQRINLPKPHFSVLSAVDDIF